MKSKWPRILLAFGSSIVLFAASSILSQCQSRYTALALSQAANSALLDVVINEVAWAGTTASASDEWIELYNNTPNTITLDGWHLIDDDNLDIDLSGELPPYSYYLIERTDDTTVSDIPGNWMGSFGYGLSNNTSGAEVLTLTNATGHIVDTANHDGGNWPAGESTTRTTMERIDPTKPDTDDNWAANDGITTCGLDADSTPLHGTPKSENSTYTADLVTAKTGSLTVKAGNIITYRITLTNTGVRTAANTLLTDSLPTAIVRYIHTGIPPTSLLIQTGNTIVWRMGDLAPEAHTIITVSGYVAENATDGLTNLVTATTTTRESNVDNNSSRWNTSIQTLIPDLDVTKTGPITTTENSTFTYHINLQNIGLSTAENCVLTDTLPQGVNFVSQQTNRPPIQFQQDQRQLIWDIGDLHGESLYLITVTVKSAETLTADWLTNVVTATTTATESALLNNNDVWTTTAQESGVPHILISGVLYDGYQTGQPDEAVQLVNAGTATAYIENWDLCKDYRGNLSCKALPSMTIAPGSRVWIVNDSAAFYVSFGIQADYTMTSWNRLADSGDEVILRDQTQTVIDTLVYNEGITPIAGWTGPGVQPYSVGREDGQILYRILDENTGLPTTDTNTAADWIQYTDNVTHARRVLYPGWDLNPLFWPLSATEPATVMVGVAPDNAYDIISQTIMRAQESISIEIYAFRHPDLIEALIQKALSGVRVSLLLEGSPVGIGVNTYEWQIQLYACQQIEATNNGQCWFMIHKTEDNIYNRYNYVHTKLMIVDETWAVISSQNFTQSSLPSDDKANGTYGSRGIVIATNAPSIVARAAKIFTLDCAPAQHNDILRWNTGYVSQYGLPIPELVDLAPFDAMSYTVHIPAPLVVSGTFDFELFTSPEASLRQSDALLGLVNRAGVGDTVYVEQMYEQWAWGDNPDDDPNLRLEAYIRAAHRGARVRILVNSKSFVEGYESPPLESTQTISYVNHIALTYHLDLRAGMGNPTGSGIHNKMILVDLQHEGQYSHVSSINGSEASSKLNREVAIQIKSAPVYDYLARLFEIDWWLSHPVFLPLLMRHHAPPAPPVGHLVISEVYYFGDANEEWMEIYNPTGETIDLSEYKIGDYDGAGYSEGLYAFPETAILPAGAVILIAGNGKNVNPPADFEFFDHNPDIPTLVKVSGDGDWALGNTGDQVLLFDPLSQLVDAVVWGTAIYPNIVPHPGITITTHSLERYPAYYDTDDCSLDFRDRYPPSPGEIPE